MRKAGEETVRTLYTAHFQDNASYSYIRLDVDLDRHISEIIICRRYIGDILELLVVNNQYIRTIGFATQMNKPIAFLMNYQVSCIH